MIVSEVIEDARALDPAFTIERHPQKVARRFLSRLQRTLVAEWVKRDKTAYTVTLEIAFPLDDFAAGYPLEELVESVAVELDVTAFRKPLALYFKNRTSPDNLDLIAWQDRHRFQGLYTWLEDGVLFFSGIVNDWKNVETVELTYTPTPSSIDSVTETFVLPETAENALVTHLGAFFARRMKQEELARPRREYIADALDAEALWLDTVERRRPADVSVQQDVY